MGTNFYLRKKQPTIHETIHIGKRSWGWLFHWDSVDKSNWPRWCDEDHPMSELPHSIHSVDDIRAYLKTGEWELVDEDGIVHPMWESTLRGFMHWDGGKESYNERHPDSPVTWYPNVPSGYRDSEGQIFDRGDGFI